MCGGGGTRTVTGREAAGRRSRSKHRTGYQIRAGMWDVGWRRGTGTQAGWTEYAFKASSFNFHLLLLFWLVLSLKI